MSYKVKVSCWSCGLSNAVEVNAPSFTCSGCGHKQDNERRNISKSVVIRGKRRSYDTPYDQNRDRFYGVERDPYSGRLEDCRCRD